MNTSFIIHGGQTPVGLALGKARTGIKFVPYLRDYLGRISVKEILESEGLVFQSAESCEMEGFDGLVIVIEFSDDGVPQNMPDAIKELFKKQFGQLSAGSYSGGHIVEVKVPRSLTSEPRKSLIFNGDEFELN